MTALAGWISTGLQPPANEVLHSMLQAGLPTDCNVQTKLGARAALGIVTRRNSARLLETESLLVAVDGAPYLAPGATSGSVDRRDVLTQIAERYRTEGPAMLRQFHGSFAITVIDRAKGEALLAIDRLGTRPLAYGTADDTLIFGSSLDMIRAHSLCRRPLDPQGIFNFFYFHMVPSPGTIYRDLHKLEPAQYLLWQNGRITHSYYWEPAFVDRGSENYADLAHRLHELLPAAIARNDTGGRAGVFLSGGVDSSTVCGIYTRVAGHPIDTYSIGFEAEGYDEMHYARITARHFGARPHEYYVSPQDTLETIPLIARLYDEPFANASAVPVYHCARLARNNGHDTMLAGDGGDELFGGNARYVKQKIFEQYCRAPRWLRRLLIDPLALGIPGSGRVPPLRKLRRYVEQARIPLPDRLETTNPLQLTPLEDIFSHELLAQINCDHPLEMLRTVYQRAPTESPINAMLYLDWKFTLADNDLRKVNRMCEAAGVDVRYPMLDDELVALSAEVPPNLKIRGFRLRWFFKQAMRGFLPDAVIRKPKHGFGLPFGVWLSHTPALQSLVDEGLARLKRRGLFNPQYIDRVVTAHRHEHAAFYGAALWSLLMFELWLENHGQPPP